MDDIRWKQRFSNFLRALQNLRSAVELMQKRELTNLEAQGVIQSFEFTHELAWNVLKDYLTDQGIQGVIGSKDASRIAFENGLITHGHHWMDMIKARNLSSHTYNIDTAEKIVENIQEKFYPAFEEMARTFNRLHETHD